MYTKGPWGRYGEFPNPVMIQPPITSTNLARIALVNAGRDEYEDNANLMAAAPDMFEALEELLANAPAPKNVKQDYSYILCREMARAALAKARGET